MPDSFAPFPLIADTHWGRPGLGYGVQIDLSLAARGAFAQLQRDLAARTRVPLLCTPDSSLHVSVYAVAPYLWEAPEKEAYWRERGAACHAALERVCARHAPVTLQFTALRVLSRAVIAVADDPRGLVAEVRHALGAVCDPRVPTPAYDLVHTTLARYASAGTLTTPLHQWAQTQRVDVAAEVSALRVVRERVYPSLALDQLACVPLSG